jgi:hypothetical protein
MTKRTTLTSIFVALLILLFSGCRGQVPPESDSGIPYETGKYIPLDHAYYVISGTVIGDVGSQVTGQTPGKISASTTGIVTGGGVILGSSSGTYFPGAVTGKGFIRFLVEKSDTTKTVDHEDLAPPGSVVILKTTDLKAIALLPNDYTTLVCRAQYEAVAAIDNSEYFDKEKAATWELDFCRIKSPVISKAVK